MGDSTCLMHGFSYASAIPNQSKQGNPMHVLGESISFGRFMSEPLSWDKWSTFPQKKYVEEAARFAQPGSVAAKKAFFEAHYRRIAAQKAAALLEQQNAANRDAMAEATGDNDDDDDQKKIVILDSQFDEKMEAAEIQNDEVNENSAASEEIQSVMSKKRSGLSSLKSSIRRKTWKLPPTPAKPVTPHFKKENNMIQSTRKSTVDSMDKKRSSPKPLRGLINLIPIKEPDKEPIYVIKKDSAGSGRPPSSSRTPKDCRTPVRTPMRATKGVLKYPASTPVSENRRTKTPIDPMAPGTKPGGPNWHMLSAVYAKSVTACRNKLQSPTLSTTPFTLRTEERAAKRKQKLDEKFNANEVQKTLKEKAGREFKKLSYSFCFKARPLPDFYKERETSINQMKENPVTQPQTAVLGRRLSNKKQGGGTVSTPPPPPKPFAKNGVSQNRPEKNVVKISKYPISSWPERRITHENKSPNILH